MINQYLDSSSPSRLHIKPTASSTRDLGPHEIPLCHSFAVSISAQHLLLLMSHMSHRQQHLRQGLGTVQAHVTLRNCSDLLLLSLNESTVLLRLSVTTTKLERIS